MENIRDDKRLQKDKHITPTTKYVLSKMYFKWFLHIKMLIILHSFSVANKNIELLLWWESVYDYKQLETI